MDERTTKGRIQIDDDLSVDEAIFLIEWGIDIEGFRKKKAEA